MIRRLRIYLTGFGIGLILVYVLFSDSDSRNLNIWTPEQRILEDIRNDSIFQVSERLACFGQCYNLSDSMMQSLWKDSKTKSLRPGGEPFIYLISLSTDQHHFEAEVELNKGNPRKLLHFRDLKNPIECKCDE